MKKKVETKKTAAKKPSAIKAKVKKAVAKKPSAVKAKVKTSACKMAEQNAVEPQESLSIEPNPNNDEMPFELLVSELVVSSPRLKLGWRIPPAIADLIRDKDKAEQAFVLLLVIDQETDEVVRLRYPLLEQIAILDYNFDHPGKYTILGTIFLNEQGCGSCVSFISQWEGFKYAYSYVIKSSDEAGNSYDVHFRHLRGHACCGLVVGRAAIGLEISSEFFSKEPPLWLRKWVDDGYPQPSRNECEFRRRALIWAFSTKLIWFIIWSIGYGIGTAFWSLVFAGYMMAGLTFGCRGLKWRAVLHPWTTEFKGYGSSWFTTKTNGTAQPWLLRLLCPPILLGICLAVYGVWRIDQCIPVVYREPLRVGSLYVLGGAMGVSLLVLVLLLVGKKAASPISKRLENLESATRQWERERIINRREKRFKRRQAEEQRKQDELQLAHAKRDIALGQLITRPDLVKIELVPRESLSWYVRWLNLKAGVCRPFAKRK